MVLCDLAVAQEGRSLESNAFLVILFPLPLLGRRWSEVVATAVVKEIESGLCARSRLSTVLRKTVFKLIFISDSYSDTSVCPSRGDCSLIRICHDFLCLGVPRHYARRPYSCWCKACSRVRGQEFKLKATSTWTRRGVQRSSFLPR